MLICFVRHGQTDWNLLGKMQGMEDIPLNDTGRLEATHCASHLKTNHWDKIYSSPLKRAVETAHIISQNIEHPFPVICENGFIERDFGIASGLTWTELKEQYPDFPNALPERMEPFPQLCERMDATTKKIAQQNQGENLLIVSHGGSINALLYHLSQGRIGTGITFLKNTGICLFHYDPVENTLSIMEHNLSPEEFSVR